MRSWIRINFWDRSRNNRQTLDLVRVSVEFHQSNAISFKWSDQFSKFHNQWEYDSLVKLSGWIRPRYSSWSVVLVIQSSCRIPFSRTFCYTIFDDAFIYNVRFPRVKSSRSLRHIPSNTHHDNILPLSSRASDFHNLQSLHDVGQCNVLLTYILVSPHSICTLKGHVLHISRHLAKRNPDVFSTRYKLFLITFEYFRVSCHLMIPVWIFIQIRIVLTYITDEWIVRTHFLEQSLQSNVLMGSIWLISKTPLLQESSTTDPLNDT